MTTEHKQQYNHSTSYKRDGKIDGVVVKNPERWLKPTITDQCGQNHVYLV